MTSIIKFHALSGVLDETPPCYILQVDEFRFLLDCGWDEGFDEEFIKELRRHVNQIDAVLLTFPDPHHLGALPYLVGKCGLSCPIFATIPVYKMGQMFMYDLYQSRYNMEDFDIFNLDDVDAAFDKIIQLKYNQSVPMKGKGYGLTIVPLPAGHMIGGTMWKIMKIGEEDIIYAIDVNHKKERHLNGCDLEKPQRPSLLITDALNATYRQDRRRLRDERLMTTILQTLRSGGNILIAVDTAGRLLELAHMLDQFWRNKTSGLLVYSLLLLNNVSYNVVEFAKSQIEWMSDKLMKSFEVQRNNPFQFKYLHLCHSLAELHKINGPKVVLASSPDLESGFARDIFLDWAADSNNSIILTTRSGATTLASRLIELEGKEKNQRRITVTFKQRVKLEGEELQRYLEANQIHHFVSLIHVHNPPKTTIKKSELAKPAQIGDIYVHLRQDKDSSDSDDDVQFLSVLKGGHDLVVKPELKKRNAKSKRKNYPMYPLLDQKIKFDDYGEIIRPEDYMLSENRDDVIELKDAKPIVEDEQIDATEVPTKCISYEKVIDVNANIQYIDFEGRSDGESIEKIISGLKPHRVILVRGSKSSTDSLANRISKLPDIKVFTPSKGDSVDATTETHIYQVRLTDGLVSALNFQKGKEMELAWLDSRVSGRKKTSLIKPINLEEPDNGHREPEEELMDIDGGLALDDLYTLEPIPICEVDPHEQVFVNEIKLNDLKVVLNKNQIDTEFSDGILWCCNNTLALRRMEKGKVCLEGAVSENYYKVRELLYSQYAIL